MNRKDRLKVKAVVNFFAMAFMAITFSASAGKVLVGVAIFLAWVMGISLQCIMDAHKKEEGHGSQEE